MSVMSCDKYNMKIVFTIAHMTIGGAQRVTYNLIKWLNDNTDASVHLIICSKLKVGNVTYDLNGISHSYASGGYFQKIQSIRRQLKQFKPDVLVTMGVPGVLFDAPACAGLGIKHIISERNDPAHFGGRTITRIISRLLMRKADGYVFQTKDAQAYYGGDMAKRSVIIPNPLFIGDDYPDTQYTGEREKTIVTTGRLNRQKNHPLLIQAFKRITEKFPDYKLMIYGEGPERQNDEILIQELGLGDRVLLPGTIDDVPKKIHKSSLYVLSSEFEGMPNALMEAMALGLPCISTDCPCGGSRELIENGKNGILVPVGDEDDLFNAMVKLLSNSCFAKKLGKNAMKIRDEFSLEKVCIQWYNYLKST